MIMGLRIQNNVEAFNAHRQLTGTAAKAAKAMEKLSSGYRVNRAADDAAGLAISEKMRAQIGGLAQAQRNAQDAVSLVQTAEGALNEVHSMLQRVRDLAVQFNNGTLATADKAAITAEVAQLGSGISKIGNDTKFNGIALPSGSTPITFQTGATAGKTPPLSGAGPRGAGNPSEATSAISSWPPPGPVPLAPIAAAIPTAPTPPGDSGPTKTRLEHTLNNLATYQENLQSSES